MSTQYDTVLILNSFVQQVVELNKLINSFIPNKHQYEIYKLQQQINILQEEMNREKLEYETSKKKREELLKNIGTLYVGKCSHITK